MEFLERRGVLSQNSGNLGGFGAPGDFRKKIPGNCEVFVVVAISNCIFGSLRDLYCFGFISTIGFRFESARAGRFWVRF